MFWDKIFYLIFTRVFLCISPPFFVRLLEPVLESPCFISILFTTGKPMMRRKSWWLCTWRLGGGRPGWWCRGWWRWQHTQWRGWGDHPQSQADNYPLQFETPVTLCRGSGWRGCQYSLSCLKKIMMIVCFFLWCLLVKVHNFEMYNAH